MKNLIVPTHRVNQVVSVLYDRWSDTKEVNGRNRSVFGRYVDESEGQFGCFASFSVNGVVYMDTELHGQLNSIENGAFVSQILND